MSIKSNNENYFSRIGTVISKSLQSHNRISAIRIDLRFPSHTICHLNDPKVITRFFESLKAKMKADLIRKSKSWERHCFSELYYVWVREFGEINNKKTLPYFNHG
ncbi:YagK/YfjJ domain-containing protein [Proteus faecis]|uniref:YagK/YfjJ domain-containing protein n=1 Tax=Proteus faecis TaxID=2050967 RepID=UPI00257A4818|nr:inovirus-type Gp2 protein [Proteus faecis]MDM3867619.1 inovirus-type Gp2 protein [Proteus faecis]